MADALRFAFPRGAFLLLAVLALGGPATAGPIEDDWDRQDRLRGSPRFEGWTDPGAEVLGSIVPAIDGHLARGRLLLDGARRRAPQGDEAPALRPSGGPADPAAGLERLVARRDALLASGSLDAAAWRDLYLEVRWAVRKIVFADPAWDFREILFVRRFTYTSSHIYTDHFDGSTRFGGDLAVLSPIAPGGAVRELVPALAGGIFGRFDLSFDGKRIVFAHKRPGEGYRIHTVGVDGTGLRQVTGDEPDEAALAARYGHGVDDLDPCWLPDGRIAFTSTRARRAVICTHNFTSTAIHVVDLDGGNLRCLSGNTVNEFAPTAMHDGRILYTRWEYVDKGAGDVQSLWSMYPDGTRSAHIYKNNVPKPPTLIDARQLPGRNGLFVCTGAPHMPLAVGPVILVDLDRGALNPAAMTSITPEIALPLHYGYPGAAKGFFKEPFPLTDHLFLVAYHFGPAHDDPAGYGLYVLDSTGHRELVYRDPKISCWQPIPLRARPVPPVLPSRPADGPAAPGPSPDGTPMAALFMADVYAGLSGIARGRVKFIRVMEDVPKPWEPSWCAPAQGDSMGLQNPAISLRGHFVIKQIHGIVPVADDGSAAFAVPAGKNLYFQALDGDHMELHRMRTFVNLMPGEARSCIGCHEPRTQAPAGRPAAASALGVQPLRPQPGDIGSRTVHYPLDVQPTLDRRCIRCHGGPEPKGGLDLTGEPTTLFCRSYENLILKKLVDHIDSDPRDNRIPAEPPLSVGSHRSKVVEVIRKGHHEVLLDREEFIRLVTWIDANAPFYGVYEGKKNIRWKGDPDFRPLPGRPVALGGSR